MNGKSEMPEQPRIHLTSRFDVSREYSIKQVLQTPARLPRSSGIICTVIVLCIVAMAIITLQ